MNAADTENLGKEVAVGKIQHELKKLWEADEASTNASLMNLLVYSENPHDLAGNAENMCELTREHACRALLIAMDRKAPETAVRAWITTLCHLSNGKKSVCCEQISFLLSGKAIGRLRNTAFANLNSDLPLVFWWQGELSGLFEEALYRLFDRLIVDSGSWQNPACGFAKIREAQEKMRDTLVVQDLSWTRGFHFRVAFAALFDDPLAQRAVGGITRAKIVARKKNRVGALLLVSWLALQAGWKRGGELALDDKKSTEKGEHYFFESAQGNSVEVELVWDDTGAPLGLLEVEAPDCLVRVTREKDSKHLMQSLQAGDHRIELSGPADADETMGLLADQLSRGGKNALYQKVLPGLAELLG